MIRLTYLIALAACVAVAVKMPTLDATVGCNHGATYSGSASYGISYSQWGHLPRGGWRGAVLGPNGDKIYGIPTNATAVLEIDPSTRAVTTFGHLGDDHSDSDCRGTVHCGEEKWIGGVLVPSSGKIIGIPYAAETVLEIDPVARTTSTFGVVSSSVKRKWVDGVLGRNGLIYAIPYDADVVLEINPETHALMLFGRVGADPCKWYGGVRGPNDKIYAIPYSSPYVLEIDTERRIARPFAMTFPHWGKWSGGVLAPNGKIYAMPALAKSVLEIDTQREQTSLFGMLPGGEDLQDKWAGAVLAPNGRIYGMPWRADKVLEFDPQTKAISLLGSALGASNFSWGGGVVASSGRIVAVPYNGAWILEIGESVCVQQSKPLAANAINGIPPPLVLPATLGTAAAASGHYSTASAELAAPTGSMGGQQPVPLKEPLAVLATPAKALATKTRYVTFVLAVLGCDDEAKGSEDACFHLAHRTWHSSMVTIMDKGASLEQIRAKAAESRLRHMPHNFCFLFNGHALDPNVEASMTAADVAVAAMAAGSQEPQFIIMLDNLNCNIVPDGLIASLATRASGPNWLFILAILFVVALVAGLIVSHCRRGSSGERIEHKYNQVPSRDAQEAQSLIHSERANEPAATAVPASPKNVPCLRPLFKPRSKPNAQVLKAVEFISRGHVSSV